MKLRLKPVLPKEHGTWVMLFLPYLLGMLLSSPRVTHGPLLTGWFLLYLSSAPLLATVRNRRLWRTMLPWTFIYLGGSLPFLLPIAVRFPHLLLLGALLVPLLGINCYYIRRKRERSLLNDLSGVITFSLGGVAAHYVGTGEWSGAAFWIAIYAILYFMGSAFYVKSMIRERKNSRFALYSHLYHLSLIPVSLLLLPQWQMLMAYLPSILKDLFTPRRSAITPLQTGFLEIVNGLLFLLIAVYTAWFFSLPM